MPFSIFKELARELDSITFHHLFERPHPDHTPEQDQADLLSFVAAHAADFLFNYAFFVEMVERRKTFGFYPLLPPTPWEFLEILEFRLAEQERVLAGGDWHWQWPSSWPTKPSWNSHVAPSPEAISETKRGILIHKGQLGHGAAIALDHWAVDRLSGLCKTFLRHADYEVGFRPLIPLVFTSLDLPTSARMNPSENHPGVWDVDGTLGEYNGGDAITIYVRAIERCSKSLRLPHRDVFLIVLIHEVAHYLVHSIPDSRSDSKREPWPRASYEKTNAAVHEGLAQLLTYWGIGSFNDHHGRTFEELVKHQSPQYRVFQDALAISDDRDKLLASIVELRLISGGATIDDWFAILRR